LALTARARRYPQNDNSEQYSTTPTLPARGENLDEAKTINPRATARTHPKRAAAILHKAGFAASEPGAANSRRPVTRVNSARSAVRKTARCVTWPQREAKRAKVAAQAAA